MYVIVAVPPEIPDTTPEDDTAATPGALLLHEPPDNEFVSVVVPPTVSNPVPLIAGGLLFTVTTFVARQPPGMVYDTVTKPPLIPVTTPDKDPTEPIVIPLLLQVPPLGPLDKVVVDPTHTLGVPVIAEGAALTEITFVL
jgi:hypothetical protein